MLKAPFPIGPSALGEEWSELQITAEKEQRCSDAFAPCQRRPQQVEARPPLYEFELRIRAPTYPWARVWWLRVCDLAADSGADEDTP